MGAGARHARPGPPHATNLDVYRQYVYYIVSTRDCTVLFIVGLPPLPIGHGDVRYTSMLVLRLHKYIRK